MKQRITVNDARALSLAAQPQCSETDLAGWCAEIEVLIEQSANAGKYLILVDAFYEANPKAKPFEADILEVFKARGFSVPCAGEPAAIGWHPIYMP